MTERIMVIFVEHGKEASETMDRMLDFDDTDDSADDSDNSAPYGVGPEDTAVPEGMNLAEQSLGVVP